MKIKELMEILSKMDPERLVVLSRDEEGNGFSVLQDAEEMHYKDGEVGYGRLTPELRDAGYGPDDIMRGGKKAVVLWP